MAFVATGWTGRSEAASLIYSREGDMIGNGRIKYNNERMDVLLLEVVKKLLVLF
jgi:hypothetical protein